MPVIDTGWVSIPSSGTITAVVVPAGAVVSARVRFKGWSKTTSTSTTTSASTSGTIPYGGSDASGTLTPASPGGGWQRDYLHGTTSAGPMFDTGSISVGIGSHSNYQTGVTSLSVSGYEWSSGSMSYVASMELGGPWSASVTAYWSYYTTTNTTNPKATANTKEVQHSGTLSNNAESAWYSCPADMFLPDTSNSVQVTVSGSARCYVQIEVTYVQGVEALLVSPDAFAAIAKDDVLLQVRPNLVNPASIATVWWPRLQVAADSSFASVDYEVDASADETGWEYYDSDSADWAALTSAGAPIDADCRYVGLTEVPTGRWHWRAAGIDDDIALWSGWSPSRQFRALLSIAQRLALEIAGADWTAYARGIRVSETTNGELGHMEFELLVGEDESGDEVMPQDGDAVALAVRDASGREEQYEGWMQGDPERVDARIVRCRVKLPDAVLAERFVLVDYASQDVGLTFQEAVDSYGAPLDSTGINTTTGFVRPVTGLGKTLLDIAKELRDQYGLVFWVKPDLTVYLLRPDQLQAPEVLVTRGQRGV